MEYTSYSKPPNLDNSMSPIFNWTSLSDSKVSCAPRAPRPSSTTRLSLYSLYFPQDAYVIKYSRSASAPGVDTHFEAVDIFKAYGQRICTHAAAAVPAKSRSPVSRRCFLFLFHSKFLGSAKYFKRSPIGVLCNLINQLHVCFKIYSSQNMLLFLSFWWFLRPIIMPIALNLFWSTTSISEQTMHLKAVVFKAIITLI